MKRSNRKPLFSLVGILGVIAALWAIGSVTAATSATKAVPSNTSPPTIKGKAEVGQTLTADKGKWAGTKPISYEYQWLRCDEQGASCASIAGADDQTYLLKQVDSGNTLRVRVVARNGEGSDTRVSSQSEVVKAATTTPPPTPTPATGCPRQGGQVQVTEVTPPARLLIDQTQIEPSTVTHGTRTVTARFHVSACGGANVQGALVYVTAVPYRQFAIPNEQATGSDGWATLTFQALSGYPVSPRQQLLVMFVRARKSSEPLLGGISTRRLVSFRVTR